MTRKAGDIPAQLRETVGEHFRPDYFVTDLNVMYNKFMRVTGLNLTHLRDRVHLIQHIVRLFSDAVREITLDVPKIATERAQEATQTQTPVLRKRLQPMLDTVLKVFSPGHESVRVLMLESVISLFEDPTVIIQTTSVQRLVRRLQRFVKKHGHAIDLLLGLSVEQGTLTGYQRYAARRDQPGRLWCHGFLLDCRPTQATIISAFYHSLGNHPSFLPVARRPVIIVPTTNSDF
ncbi:MAG: hypothetical protein GY832_30765 [Chloroflexi bacterium]|nr:hypothetical protein [Chloroflexota bacterium]